MKLVVYLDLDRTLFKTDLGVKLIWQEIAKINSGVDVDRELAAISDFYAYSEDAYAYDLVTHIASLGLDSSHIFDELRLSEIADGRLEYKGAKELINWINTNGGQVKVLTYGFDDYQRLKASLCPSITSVEVITTLGAKMEYLKDKGNLWLIDDKVPSNIVDNVNFIQAIGYNDVADATGGRFPVARSLNEVKDLLAKNSEV